MRAERVLVLGCPLSRFSLATSASRMWSGPDNRLKCVVIAALDQHEISIRALNAPPRAERSAADDKDALRLR
jgi:hypothetical protein